MPGGDLGIFPAPLLSPYVVGHDLLRANALRDPTLNRFFPVVLRADTIDQAGGEIRIAAQTRINVINGAITSSTYGNGAGGNIVVSAPLVSIEASRFPEVSFEENRNLLVLSSPLSVGAIGNAAENGFIYVIAPGSLRISGGPGILFTNFQLEGAAKPLLVNTVLADIAYSNGFGNKGAIRITSPDIELGDKVVIAGYAVFDSLHCNCRGPMFTLNQDFRRMESSFP